VPLTNDAEKLSSIVRSVSQNNEARDNQSRNSQQQPPPSWEQQQDRPRSRGSSNRNRDSRDSHSHSNRHSKDSQRERIERYGSVSKGHGRNGSSGTGATGQHSNQSDYPPEIQSHGGRKHDYDVESMETDLSSPRQSLGRNPIPPPTVTVRSEYPTLVRSKQSQTLTCLITIEVPEGKWTPTPEDIRDTPTPHASNQHHHQSQPPPPKAAPRAASEDRQPKLPAGWVNETPAELSQVTEDLRVRVENWHGLDFSRYFMFYSSLLIWVQELTPIGLATCDYIAISRLARTGNHGRNWNVSSSARC
jgi:hypothetical protein